jgi:hypothetical protein
MEKVSMYVKVISAKVNGRMMLFRVKKRNTVIFRIIIDDSPYPFLFFIFA